MTDPKLQKAYEAECKTIKETIQGGDLPGSAFQATKAHHARTDEAKASIEDYSKVTMACGKGCHYCCHFKVEAGAEEIFLIADYVANNFNQSEIDDIIEKAKENEKTITNLTQAKRIQTNLACALLKDGECSVHSVRPSACRKMHSLDVEPCKASFERPEDATIQNSEDPLVASVLLTMGSAARQGFKEAELDSSLYDLNEMLYKALSDNKYQKRWKKGKRAFV